MIEFTRVSKQYAREVYALRDITLSVKKGELISWPALPVPASPRC
jgi:cell division transport system ATP-binding protein